jgi:hypothetical protein
LSVPDARRRKPLLQTRLLAHVAGQAQSCPRRRPRGGAGGRHGLGPALARHARRSAESTPQDRQAKGFNAVLLMSVQPDMGARGPRDRSADEGFDVGFEDLPDGHINQLNPAYFQYLDGSARSWPSTRSWRCGSRSSLALAGRGCA